MVRLEAEVETRDATRDATDISKYVSGDSDTLFGKDTSHTGIQDIPVDTGSFLDFVTKTVTLVTSLSILASQPIE